MVHNYIKMSTPEHIAVAANSAAWEACRQVYAIFAQAEVKFMRDPTDENRVAKMAAYVAYQNAEVIKNSALDESAKAYRAATNT